MGDMVESGRIFRGECVYNRKLAAEARKEFVHKLLNCAMPLTIKRKEPKMDRAHTVALDAPQSESFRFWGGFWRSLCCGRFSL